MAFIQADYGLASKCMTVRVDESHLLFNKAANSIPINNRCQVWFDRDTGFIGVRHTDDERCPKVTVTNNDRKLISVRSIMQGFGIRPVPKTYPVTLDKENGLWVFGPIEEVQDGERTEVPAG